jgi:hypothetical protein
MTTRTGTRRRLPASLAAAFLLAAAPASARRLTIRCDGGAWLASDGARDARATTAPWRIDGRDGEDDWLTVDLSAAGSCGPLPDIAFDGGAGGYDGMSVVGSGTEHVSYEPDRERFGAGRFRVGTSTIAFTNLEPTDVSGVVTFTLTLPGAADSVTLVNGIDFGTGTMAAVRISGTSGGSPFETVAVRNVTNLVVDTSAVDGNDTITVTSASNAHLIANITLKTGSGADSIALNGAVTVTGVVSLQAATITEAAAGAINAAGLAVRAANSVGLNQANSVTNLAASITASGASFSYNDANNVAIQAVDGVTGITTSNGGVTVTTVNGDIDVAENVTTGSGAVFMVAGTGVGGHLLTNRKTIASTHAGVAITLIADAMDLKGTSAIQAGSSDVELFAATSGNTIHLGNAADTSLNFSDAELDTITAGNLHLRSTMDVSVDAPISLSTVPALVLDSPSGAVTQAGGATVTVPRLAATAGTHVTLTQGNSAGLLAGFSGTGFSFTNASSFEVGSVSNFVGVVAFGGTLTLTALSGSVTIGGPVTASGSFTVTAPANVKGRKGGDVSGNGVTDVNDVFYLINFLFAGGPPPP